ncbi:MAG: hypothetical protein P4L43_02645 [Syntrophobacteraceae bacterium]|nr:hypothetical protein [Syntrophobacteraceae bacterium]
MKAEWKRFLDENEILAICAVDPDSEDEVVYICCDCITEEDFPEEWDNPLESPFRTETDLKEDSAFVGISQFRPVRCCRCGKEILSGYRFASFREDFP